MNPLTAKTTAVREQIRNVAIIAHVESILMRSAWGRRRNMIGSTPVSRANRARVVGSLPIETTGWRM